MQDQMYRVEYLASLSKTRWGQHGNLVRDELGKCQTDDTEMAVLYCHGRKNPPNDSVNGRASQMVG